MRLGLYTFVSLVFIGLVAGIVYVLAPGNYVLGVSWLPSLNLPIALWVVLPLVVFLLLTLFHMLFHGTRNYFVKRKWNRDIDTMQDALYWSLIKEPKEHSYSIPEIAKGASLLSGSTLDVINIPQGISSKLAKAAEWVQQIGSGEYVDLKKLKVEKFMSKDNTLLIQNLINRLEKEPEFADNILRDRESYDDSVVSKAIEQAVASETLFKLQKYANLLDFDEISTLLDRADAGEDIGFSIDTLESLIRDKDLTCTQYMRIVQSAINAFDPDQNIAFFKKLSQEKPEAESAYLFLLFRYEMIDKAESFLDEHEDDDFSAFRAFLTLKKSKYNYKVRDFITAVNTCR
jgi:hypothetical protein